jgi:ribosomal protein S18 acetylase RimI-like enzyme
MISLQPLLELSHADFEQVAGQYTCTETYKVTYADSDTGTTFQIQLVPLEQPFIGKYDHFDQETVDRYRQVVKHGFSVGAYAGTDLVGMLIADVQEWNSSLWVWEFHVAASYRGQGIGRMMMEWAAEKAQAAGLRTIVCETQNQNASAIHAYRKLGFQLEGIDISYYTNTDYPDRGIAVFMKRRINPVQ